MESPPDTASRPQRSPRSPALRPGTPAFRLAGRWRWRAGAIAIFGLAALFEVVWGGGTVRVASMELTSLVIAPILSLVTLSLVAGLDLASRREFRAVARFVPSMQMRDAWSSPLRPETRIVDLGTGKMEFELAIPRATPDADRDPLAFVLRGDPRKIEAALRLALSVDFLLIALLVAFLVIHLGGASVSSLFPQIAPESP